MSVYTAVEPAQLERFLTRYALGKLIEFSPIVAGITNTNYFLETDNGSFVLTLYEHLSDDELDYILGLQQHLVKLAVRCSEAMPDRRGNLFSMLNNRPAAIIRRLPGQVLALAAPRQCSLIGAELARFHLAGENFGGFRPNPRDVDWIVAVSDMLATSLGGQDRQLIGDCLRAVDQLDLQSLPQGAIHADLFLDNALFLDEEMSGILDFDYACSGSFVFDIAVLLNDWCIDAEGELVVAQVRAVLDGYQQYRRFEPIELSALPAMLRLAALRFWLSRLYDATFPLSGELTFIKRPEVYREMLISRGRPNQEFEELGKALSKSA